MIDSIKKNLHYNILLYLLSSLNLFPQAHFSPTFPLVYPPFPPNFQYETKDKAKKWKEIRETAREKGGIFNFTLHRVFNYITVKKKKTHSLFSLLPLSVSLHPFPPNPRPSPLSLYSFPPYFISPPTPYFIFFLWTCVFVPINLKIYFHFMRENAVEKKERGKNQAGVEERGIMMKGRRGEKSSWRGGNRGSGEVGGRESV